MFSIDPLEIYMTHLTIYFIHNIIKYCRHLCYKIRFFFCTGLTSRVQHYINIWIAYNKIRIRKQLCLEIRSADYATVTVRRIYCSAHPHTYTLIHPRGKTITYTYISYTVHWAHKQYNISANRFVEKLFVGGGWGGATNGV